MPAARAVAMSVPESPTMTARVGNAAGRRDGAPQDLRVGLLDAERVLAADRRKAPASGRARRAAGATAARACWCRPRTGSRRPSQPVERLIEAGERPRAVGDVRGVVCDEIGEHAVDRRCARRCRPSSRRPLSIIRRAPPPIMLRACAYSIGGRPFAREHDVERVDQIGRGVDQGAVEVEDDGQGGHAFRLSWGSVNGG